MRPQRDALLARVRRLAGPEAGGAGSVLAGELAQRYCDAAGAAELDEAKGQFTPEELRDIVALRELIVAAREAAEASGEPLQDQSDWRQALCFAIELEQRLDGLVE